MNEAAIQNTNQQLFSGSLQEYIDQSANRIAASGKSGIAFLVQIDNMTDLRKRRPAHVVNSLLRELFLNIRQAVHPSQFVGYFEDGVAVVLEGADPGQIDRIGQRLIGLARHVIREGRYNDLTSRWTDILYQFLSPTVASLLIPSIGWAVYPRDGNTSQAVVARCKKSLEQFRKR